MNSVDRGRLEEIVEGFADQPILVVGDLILDQFIWGEVERISPEAPVPVVKVLRESYHLGGAANVAGNLAALGARPVIIGVVGDDEAGDRLLDELGKREISGDGVIREPGLTTTLKTRIVAQHQQVCRTDREGGRQYSRPLLGRIQDRCRSLLPQTRATVVSDYAKGVLSSEIVPSLVEGCRESASFMAVDPKGADFSIYRGASLVTPNKKEAERACGIEMGGQENFFEVGKKLLAATGSDYLLITQGEEGMTLFHGETHTHIPTVAREVYDVTGAGDTVIASLTLAVAAGASVLEAAVVANHAAGVVVAKLGTAAATVPEIRSSIRNPLAPGNESSILLGGDPLS